ncbi:MAG TPA: hypothetical protein IAA06_14455 [Candidatus Blautia faecavium]|uniref:Iron transporter n=1 Tax=Candidatus Blautia faecavium TaxID=2838487 RepID=A0A9D2LUZ9_9FIRM|nr:hypothetical protein [Candidatus Blautia faecavium]
MKRLRVFALAAMFLAGSLSCGVSCYAGEKEDSTQEKESMVATQDEMAAPVDVVEEGMVPVYGKDIQDGTYSIEVESSSTMFKIADCQLTVEEDEMTAVMTLGGTGYLKLFMGTGEEAVEASQEEYIPYVENEEGQYTYEVPVEALDMGIDCAAFSKNKEKWYDRTLVFKSASLPQDALLNIQMTTAEALGLKDGTYSIEVELEGGSGRTEVDSPAYIEVKDGTVTATVTWMSPYYDYVLVDGKKYEGENTEETSAFEIPVEGFDWKMPVTADTIAMSVPHEIDYTLFFDSSTIEKADQ